MKAIIWTRYGDPDGLLPGEVENPVPADHEVLIQIHASTVTAGDCEMRSLKFPLFLGLPMRMYAGWKKPQRITILGQELAGKIVSTGKDVNLFKEGDLVFGSTGPTMGGYAEYICIPEKPKAAFLEIIPKNMTLAEAATIPVGGLEAFHFLNKVDLQKGQKILINGAGGSIGTYGVQLAKYFQAEVTAVDSIAKLDMLRSIGADHVIDYTMEDFTRNGITYDVIFDVVGKSSYTRVMRSLTKKGCYLLANPSFSKIFRSLWTSMTGSRKVVFGFQKRNEETLLVLKELIEAGKLKSVIDRTYPLEQVADAHLYVETGQKKGNVVITVKQ